jgi:3-oxoacyl-[acyl-carrier-protein] synthase-3
MNSFIVGSGTSLPERIVTNEELAEPLGLDPEWIYKASGIRRRRWVQSGTPTSALIQPALKNALENAQLQSSDLDYLLIGTMTPDRFIPGTAGTVQHSLGLPEIPCVDIQAACCNALYGLQLADALITSGAVNNVAIGLGDVQSPSLEMAPAAGTISMLFGDGASALILSRNQQAGALQLIDMVLGTDGSFVDDLGIRAPGTEFGNPKTHSVSENPKDYYPRMAGQSVILHASRKIVTACETILARNNLTVEDVRWIVPHQANANLLKQIARALHFKRENGMVSVIEDLGNTSSASMGLALDHLRRSGEITANDYLLLPAFAAGFTWGAALGRACP